MASPFRSTLPNVRAVRDAYQALTPEELRQFHAESVDDDPNGRGPAPAPEDPWHAFTLADAYQVRPPVEYVAAGLFAFASLNIVYGAPGTLKSFLMADLTVSAAAGGTWLPSAPWARSGLVGSGPFGIATRKSPCMWLDFDNGRRRTHDRFGALGRARSLPEETPLFYYSMPSPWLNAADKGSIGNLSLRMLERGVKLVVVDNLGVVSGDADENSGDMVGVMSEFRQLAEETGAAVVLIHHQRKSNGSAGRVGDTLRGHSSIEAALDLALLVEREELSDTISIKATKVRGADVLPFSAAFHFDARPDGELNTAIFYGIAADDTRSGGAIEREILVALINTSLNKTDLTKSVKEALPDVGVNRIRDMIDRLASAGTLRVSNGRNNTERLYSRGASG